MMNKLNELSIDSLHRENATTSTSNSETLTYDKIEALFDSMPKPINLKEELFAKFMPDVPKNKIDDYIVILPKSMEVKLMFEEGWLFFNEHCDKPICMKKGTFAMDYSKELGALRWQHK